MAKIHRGNRRIYRCWALVYHAVAGRCYAAGRRQTIGVLAAHAGQVVLLPRVGTGADLPVR